MEGHPANCSATLSPDFEDILKSDTFVDKTALILAVFKTTLQPMVLCTAPRRFGKTVNLNMMQLFLELEVDENGKEKTEVLEEKDNYKLFNSARFKLKVMDNKKFVTTHFGQYPIIKINFLCADNVKGQSDAVRVCRDAISQAFLNHKYLYKSKESPLEDDEKKICEQWCDLIGYEGIPDDDVIEGLADLAVFLNKFHKKKVLLLVDEYDSIVSNALYNVKNADPQKDCKELERIITFLIRVIGYALKLYANIFQGAYITGILGISGIGTSSLLGNVMRRQFGTPNLCQDFYGFNEDEVLTLFERFSVGEELKKKAMAKYNGYVNWEKKPLCNPQSIVQFLHNLQLGEGALQNYWRQSGYIQHLYNLFQVDDVRKLLYKLLQGAVNWKTSITPLELSDLKSLHDLLNHSNVTCDEEVVVNFLISLGYLTYSENDNMLKIPNGELMDEFNERLYNSFSLKYGIKEEAAWACSRSFSQLARLCDERDSDAKFKEELATFQQTLTCLLQTATNIIDPLNDATLQVLVSLVCSQRGFVFGNEIIIPKHGTKIDMVLYNDTFGCVVEIKCIAQSSRDALEQIFTRHYWEVFTMEKYFKDRQKSPSLCLVMGMHVDSEKKASVLCLRKMDIIDVLDDLKVDATKSLENRIQLAVETCGKIAIDMFLEKASGST